MAIELFGCGSPSMGGIKTLRLATRDINGIPLSFPLDIKLKQNDESIIELIDDAIMHVITIGGVDISYRVVYPIASDFKEEEVTDRQGRFYTKSLAWEMPQLTLTTNNQLKDFLFTTSGEFAISNAVAFITDTNDNNWIIGWDNPLVLQTFDIQTDIESGENKYVLQYVSKSYRRIQQYSTQILPIVTTLGITSITDSVASGGGNVVDIGSAAITQFGICWSTNPNPTTANSTYGNVGSTSNYLSTLSGLNPLTTYYVRAFATNSVGTSYGNQVSFQTVGMIYHWTFNNTLTDTVQGLVLQTGGTLTYESGLTGNCLQTVYDFPASWVHSTDSTLCGWLSGVKPFTLSAWYYLPTIEYRFQVMIMNGGNTSVGTNSGQNTGTFNYCVNPDSNGIRYVNRTRYGYYYSTGVLPVAGQWNHFVLTFDGSTTKFYINNSLRNTSVDSTSISVTDFAWINYQDGDFEYKLDSARIYNYALSTGEISALYNSGSGI